MVHCVHIQQAYSTTAVNHKVIHSLQLTFPRIDDYT